VGGHGKFKNRPDYAFLEENAKPLRLDHKFMMSSTNKFNLLKKIVETDGLRLQVSKDFGITNCPSRTPVQEPQQPPQRYSWKSFKVLVNK